MLTLEHGDDCRVTASLLIWHSCDCVNDLDILEDVSVDDLVQLNDQQLTELLTPAVPSTA